MYFLNVNKVMHATSKFIQKIKCNSSYKFARNDSYVCLFVLSLLSCYTKSFLLVPFEFIFIYLYQRAYL
jgi:hypothetical protein